MKIKRFIECVEKPSKEEFTITNITVGKIYPVTWIDNDDYKIIDDRKQERYYRHRFFKDATWQDEMAQAIKINNL